MRLVVTAIFAVVLPLAVLSAQRPKAVVPMFRPLSVLGEAAPEMSRYSLRAFAALVNCAGGDFRVGTFPAEGHDAWTTAWREDAVWDWMFSKSLKGPVRQLTKKGRLAEPVSLSLSKAECTASVEGIDHAHGPERAVDGLDATWYESARPFSPAFQIGQR